MIGWSTIGPFLLQLYGELAQDPALIVDPVDGDGGTRKFDAEWKEGQRPVIHDVQRFALMLKLTNVSSVGRDENRREFFQKIISAVTQTGPGTRGILITGDPTTDGDGLVTVTLAGAMGVAQASWSYGAENGALTITSVPQALGTTGLFLAGDSGGSGNYFLNTTFEWDATAARLEEKVVGMRKFTIQVQAHCSERADDMMAMIPLDRVRVGLRRRSTLDRLHAQELSLIRITDSVKANYKDASHVVSAASMDVVMYAAFDSVDPIPANWIETIFYTSHLQDVDGIELPVPPNVVNQQIPPP